MSRGNSVDTVAAREAAAMRVVLGLATGARYEAAQPPVRFRVKKKEIRWVLRIVGQQESRRVPHANLAWADRFGCYNVESAVFKGGHTQASKVSEEADSKSLERGEKTAWRVSARYRTPVRIIRETRQGTVSFRLGAKIQVDMSSKHVIRETRSAVKALRRAWSLIVTSERRDARGS